VVLAPLIETIAGLRWPPAIDTERSESLFRIVGNWIAFGAMLISAMLPTFITRQIVYGSPFQSGYPAISTWLWTSPVLLKILFSSDHGMLSWTPILAISILGIAFLWKRDRLLSGSLCAIVLAYYYLIASYVNWDGISSFGNRFFVSLTLVFVIGLATFLGKLSEWLGSNARAWAAAAVLVGLSILWNVGFMFQWGTHLVPARGPISWEVMARNQFTAVPKDVAEDLEIYVFRRRSMLRHIEQEDTDQLRAPSSRTAPGQP
jgi:hypothetical protein